MNKSTKYLMVLVGTVALFALALSVVGPALAQSATGGTPQAGATVALQSGDTLGVLVDRYSLSGDNLRNFLILNSGLKLDSGQTVNFPPDVNVNLGGQGQGTSGSMSASASTSTPAAGATSASTAVATSASTSGSASGQMLTDAQILAFVNMNKDLTFSSGQSVVLPAGVPATGAATNTPEATSPATSAATSAATNTPEATATTAANANTYTTKDGDTLGTILGFMGFQGIPATGAGAGAGAGATATGTSAATNTPEATTAATNTPEATATTAAGGAAGAGATATATPAAGAAAGATATPAAGCEANYSVKAGDTLTAIAQRCGITLQQLVDANPNLLQAGSTLNIPAKSASSGSTGNIPATGGSQAQASEGGFSGLNSSLLPNDVQRGEGVYIVHRGDSLSSIARRFNTTVEWLLTHNNTIKNANLIFRGQHMVVPQGEEIGVWNYNLLNQEAQNSAVVPVPSATPAP